MNNTYMKLKELLAVKEQELKGTNDVFSMSLLTFPGYVSSSRGVMYTSHLKHMLTINQPEVPNVFTHYENMLGKLSSGYKKANADLEVYAKVSKYSHMPNHKYVLFTYDPEKDLYDIVEKKNYENLTEKFGYAYNNDVMDTKEVGSSISKGEVLYKTNSYDEHMNYGFGRNVKFIFTMDNDTIEDAIYCSDQLAKDFSFTEVDTVKTTLNDNDILGNLYGDNEHYKAFPDIGEPVKKRILCNKKRIFNNQILFDLKMSNLRKVNFASDTPFYSDGVVVDIDIFCNKVIDEIVETPFNAQLLFYLREQQRYYTEINRICTEIINSGSNYSKDINYMFKRTSDILDVDYKWRDEDNIFSNMIIEFTTANIVPLEIGSKITGRYGNKGVISIIKPKEEMQFTINENGEKEYVDMCVNLAGVPNRNNFAQLFESSITHQCKQIIRKFKNEDLSLKDKEEIFFDYFKIVHQKQYLELKNYYASFKTKERKEEFFDNVVKNGMKVQMDLLYEDEPIFFKLMKAYQRFPWLGLEDLYIHKWGRDIKILRPFVVGTMYMIRLKQTSKKNFSSRSLAGIGVKNVPEKSNKAKLHQELYPKTPIKVGDQENLNLTIGVDTDTIADLHRYYRSSPIARRDTASKLTNPYEIEDFEHSIHYNNINSEILNAYLKTLGVRLEFSDTYYDIPMYSTVMDSHEIDGELVICDDLDYEKIIAKKKVEEHYATNECIIDSVENYDKFIDERVDDYLFEKDGGLVVELGE